ncbi:MAG: helix-turn-helix domain-containing protein [Gammaproteobacteria bacterium]|nr:helix-turn-helix domain-containing protein [Gammaproteobacteria bacterium]
MIIRKLRLQHGWSQEELAAMTGLSVRTIQRVEKGQKMSLETKRALAAVFEVTQNTLQEEDTTMETSNTDLPTEPQKDQREQEERDAFDYAKGIKSLLTHVGVFIPLGILMFSQTMERPELTNVLIFWCGALVVHVLYALDVLGLQTFIKRKNREGWVCHAKFDREFLKAQTPEQRLAILKAKRVRSWYENIAVFVLFIIVWAINGDLLPLTLENPFLPWIGLWAIAVVGHGLVAFGIVRVFGAEWEKDIIEKRLGRKL